MLALASCLSKPENSQAFASLREDVSGLPVPARVLTRDGGFVVTPKRGRQAAHATQAQKSRSLAKERLF